MCVCVCVCVWCVCGVGGGLPVNVPIRRTVNFAIFIPEDDANGACTDTEILSPLPGIEPGPLASEASKLTTELI